VSLRETQRRNTDNRPTRFVSKLHGVTEDLPRESDKVVDVGVVVAVCDADIPRALHSELQSAIHEGGTGRG
jgi:hypothetical protein